MKRDELLRIIDDTEKQITDATNKFLSVRNKIRRLYQQLQSGKARNTANGLMVSTEVINREFRVLSGILEDSRYIILNQRDDDE